MSNMKRPELCIDKRSNRTRRALAQAMIDLGGREGVDNVTPGTLAREAGVSRSTFYANFASKDDYLDRAFAAMFQSCDLAQKRDRPGDTGVLPSWHFFQHVSTAKGFASSMAKSDAFPQYMAAREALFRDLATKNLKATMPDTPKDMRDNLASMLAGAFAGLLRRWMESGLTTPPEELHEAFEKLVRGIFQP